MEFMKERRRPGMLHPGPFLSVLKRKSDHGAPAEWIKTIQLSRVQGDGLDKKYPDRPEVQNSIPTDWWSQATRVHADTGFSFRTECAQLEGCLLSVLY
jgi:hypothetical protein